MKMSSSLKQLIFLSIHTHHSLYPCFVHARCNNPNPPEFTSEYKHLRGGGGPYPQTPLARFAYLPYFLALPTSKSCVTTCILLCCHATSTHHTIIPELSNIKLYYTNNIRKYCLISQTTMQQRWL